MKQRIAIDMDDVMADTYGKLASLYLNGAAPRYTLAELREKSFHELLDEGEFTSLFAQVHTPGFFADIAVMEGAQDTIARLMEHYEVFVATAAMEFPNSLREKYDWLGRHFPAISWRNFIFLGDKSILGADYLIDDLPRNLLTFSGQGLLFTAPHNRDEKAFLRVNNWAEVADRLL